MIPYSPAYDSQFFLQNYTKMKKKAEYVSEKKRKVYNSWVVKSLKCAYRMKLISSDAEMSIVSQ